MTATPTEVRVLELLRNRYESEGFSFIEHPAPANLPAFMHGYRPDALALGEGKSIVIEVKLRKDPAPKRTCRQLANVSKDNLVGSSAWFMAKR